MTEETRAADVTLKRPPSTALWTCYGGMMSLAVAVNLPPVFLTTFGREFGGAAGLTAEQLGRISACVFASVTAGILVSGPLADRWGAKPFALFGLGMTAGGLGLLGTAANYPMLLAAAALMGLGSGVLDMILSPIVCALQPERRAQAMNYLHAFYCIGAVGTVLVASLALRLAVSWRGVCFLMTVLPAAVFVSFARMSVPALVDERHSRHPVAELLRNPCFAASLLAIALAGAAEQGLSQWLPAYAERSLGYSKTAAGLALAGFLVAMIIGRTTSAAWTKLARPSRRMLVCCVLAAACYLVGCFCPAPAIAVSACIAVGLMVSCLWPTMLGVTADHFPNGGASMFALLAASGNFGCFLMPWLVGVVAVHTGRLNLGLASATACPIALALLLVLVLTDTPTASAQG